MKENHRAPGQTSFSVSLGESLLKEIDARAKKLGLNRSQYLGQLAKRDIENGGELVLKPTYQSEKKIDPLRPTLKEKLREAYADKPRKASNG